MIGRNEGNRLITCLEAVDASKHVSVYVDSASTDGSRSRARAAGFDVVELGVAPPPNAARARNAGFQRLLEIDDRIQFVQFVDGDTALDRAWIETGMDELVEQPGVAIVCGALLERGADTSFLRKLCQMEWAREPGVADACGGIMLARRRSLEDVGGFCEEMIGGEEAELCRRISNAGGMILQSHHLMGVHDSGVDRVSQWMRRAVRGGFAYANAVALHPSDAHKRRKALSAAIYGIGLPVAILAFTLLAFRGFAWSALLAGAAVVPYAIVAERSRRAMMRRGSTRRDARLYASFCVLAKPCEGWGVLKFLFCKIFRVQPRWIEYKRTTPSQGNASLSDTSEEQ